MLTSTKGDLAALGERIIDMFTHLIDRARVDQRAEVGVFFKPVAHLHRGQPIGQLLGEGIVNPGLNIDAVGTDAGLTVVAKLAHDRAFHGRIEVSIVKNDERSVTAQFH